MHQRLYSFAYNARLILLQFGIDPIKFFHALVSLKWFIGDLYKFKKKYSGRLGLYPCLHNQEEDAGYTNSEYFWQDLLVAQEIYKARPLKHLDIGSRIDGFVAHLASFRKVDVWDTRSLNVTIPNVTFSNVDIMQFDRLEANNQAILQTNYDSVSCLHVLEHIGLGRYGDNVDPFGYRVAFSNILRVLPANGILYLSTPVGQERVEFNANWIFSPFTIMDMAIKESLTLKHLYLIERNNVQHFSGNEVAIPLYNCSLKPYTLAIFIFKK